MKIHLEELPHQEEALKAIVKHFPRIDNVTLDKDKNYIYANPIIENRGKESKFIDIKMETGTGKTYVYTRAIYELHKLYGHNKFVIVVPSLAIKEGTKNFINSNYARQHFAKFYPNKNIELQLINSGDFSSKRGKHKTFPGGLMQFCEGSLNEKNTIQVLLVNTHMLQSRSFKANDYDQTLIGGSNCPVDGIKLTRPIVLIDEPHRISKVSRGYAAIKSLKPQSIIRFGATFPARSEGSGRNKRTVTDYCQGKPQFELGAVDAFNQDLVKGVRVQYPIINNNSNKYQVKSVTANELILESVDQNRTQEWTVNVNENLANVDPNFAGGVVYNGNKKLSNDLELTKGMKLYAGVFTNSYQEILLKQAINAHFEIEIANFHRPKDLGGDGGYKIKTNALFFIDSITSYRDTDDDGNPTGWLRAKFEQLLRRKIEELLQVYTNGEYHDFLETTLNNISKSHGGYFAKDWGEADDTAIAEEVQDILHKERTLPFKKIIGKNADGSNKEVWNIRRFFFSKWTLREGWDNPNVFTICKLRSSGSEISKIQEVGRGLRLPVDEQGNRLQSEEWKLNFIIDESESDFANKLIGEINTDAKVILNKEKLTDEMIKIIVDESNITKNDLLKRLINDLKIINFEHDFQSNITINNETKNGHDWLIHFYPELLEETAVKNGKISSPNISKQKPTNLRQENWKKIKNIWQEISKRYLLKFERLEKDEVEDLFSKALENDNVFNDNETVAITIQTTRENEEVDEIGLIDETITIENIGLFGELTYNKFVKKLNERTAIPISIIHNKLWERLKKFEGSATKEEINRKLNTNSLEKICQIWEIKFNETFAQKYEYIPLDYTAETSVLKNGNFVSEIAAGMVGKYPANDVNDDDRNLYYKPTGFDSDIEHQVEKINPPNNVTVFGKVPRRAIKVPTYTGGSTTPDFIFHKRTEDANSLTLIVETKSSDMRGAEKRAVDAQKKLFKNINGVKWKLATSANDVQQSLSDL